MSELSPRLGLPFLMAAQAQKHVTHNEALLRLDQLTQLVLQALDATDPPEDPLDGQIWALGATPTGDWAGQGGDLAAWFDDAWYFITPGAGWQACFGTATVIFDGAAWVAADLPDLENLPGIGINAALDAANRLTVAAEATLLNHEGAGHQLKLNKATASDTASLLFQTGFAGRAEMGTAGNDDFSVKVSADGSTWHDGLVVARASGAVSAPNGLNAATLTRAGSPVYARSTILGTVSQSGGVPTGAVIQRGSNANGEFVRFADGTQLCWQSISVTDQAIDSAYGSLFIGSRLWTFPAQFSAAPTVVAPSARWGTGASWCSVASNTNTSATLRFFDAISRTTGTTFTAGFAAVGRWFNL